MSASSNEFPQKQYSSQFVELGTKTNARNLRLAICNAKKSGGWIFGVVVSFRLLDVHVHPRHIASLPRSDNDESFSEPCSPLLTLNRVFP